MDAGTAPCQLVTLEDESGWTPSMSDIVNNAELLTPVLLSCPAVVPALGFLALSLQLADKIVGGGRMLQPPQEVDAYKYLSFVYQKHVLFSRLVSKDLVRIISGCITLVITLLLVFIIFLPAATSIARFFVLFQLGILTTFCAAVVFSKGFSPLSAQPSFSARDSHHFLHSRRFQLGILS
jgi:hypothetical protein